MNGQLDENVEVPNVLGMSQPEAWKALTDVGLDFVAASHDVYLSSNAKVVG